jgi:outer membrane PBP1 activator LpoA protein
MNSATRNRRMNPRALLIVLLTMVLCGCGKSAEQQAVEDAKWKKAEADAAAAAQAELVADSERFRKAATGQ